MPTEEGRTVLITGASSGIGRATALYLAERGYAVIGTSRSLARLDGLVADALRRGVAVRPLEMDINSDAGVDAVVPALLGEVGAVDVLVNNAGFGLWGPVESLSLEQVKLVFETNFFAAVRLIKAVLPAMVARRRGTIVNVSSVAGRLAPPFNGAYAATKFALEGMSEALRTEVWPFGVRVALVEPGVVRTDFAARSVVGERARSLGSVYAPHLERYDRLHTRFLRSPHDPVKVARVIHRIVRSRRPALRHPVGFEARLGMLGVRLLPERLFRTLMSRATIGQ